MKKSKIRWIYKSFWKKIFFFSFLFQRCKLVLSVRPSFFVPHWVIAYFLKYGILYFCCPPFILSTVSPIFYSLSSRPFLLHSWLFFHLLFSIYQYISHSLWFHSFHKHFIGNRQRIKITSKLIFFLFLIFSCFHSMLFTPIILSYSCVDFIPASLSEEWCIHWYSIRRIMHLNSENMVMVVRGFWNHSLLIWNTTPHNTTPHNPTQQHNPTTTHNSTDSETLQNKTQHITTLPGHPIQHMNTRHIKHTHTPYNFQSIRMRSIFYYFSPNFISFCLFSFWILFLSYFTLFSYKPPPSFFLPHLIVLNCCTLSSLLAIHTHLVRKSSGNEIAYVS